MMFRVVSLYLLTQESSPQFKGRIPVGACTNDCFAAVKRDNVDDIFAVQDRPEVSELQRGSVAGS